MSFTAPAGAAFRLWIRGKALQRLGLQRFCPRAVLRQRDARAGRPSIASAPRPETYVNLEEANGAAFRAGAGRTTASAAGVLGPLVYFADSGTHTIRVQVREDGFSIDQIVLSPDTFLNAAPGANKLDQTKLPKQNGAGARRRRRRTQARVLADAYVRGGPSASTSFGAASETDREVQRRRRSICARRT